MISLKKMFPNDVFKTQQANGYAFRAEFVRYQSKIALWIAESAEEVYVLSILNVVRMEPYLPKLGDHEKVLMLYRNEDEEIETVEIGNFTHDDAANFVRWVQVSLHPPRPLASAVSPISREHQRE
jgi:hypothetical protein